MISHPSLSVLVLIGSANATLAAPLDDSIRVVAILEAAAHSMANGGTLEAVYDGSN